MGVEVISQPKLVHCQVFGIVSVMPWIDTGAPVALIIQIVKLIVCPGA